ncbi:apolipoprotein D-like [Adelges cooleyi]|uniref:apolipoprotein D-like n=1 Tax=Adelges cooleyi TaxID=133065 RepID=UPI00217F605D|nr:apolipoprotein D-like [Adelges cooleyi]
MKFNGLRILSMLLVSSLNVVSGHQCLNLDPMEDFEMEKFLGKWYVVKTTFPENRCLVYDFYTQKIENMIEYAEKSNYSFYFGVLKAKSSKLPSEMTYTDLLTDYSNDHVEDPSFIVLYTDYVSFALVYMCIHLTNDNAFVHYITIMSRSVMLDNEIINDLIVNIFSVARAPLNLNHVDHKNCNYGTLVEDGDDQNVIDDDDDRRPYVSIEWMIEPTP